jgi:hypothetical protein
MSKQLATQHSFSLNSFQEVCEFADKIQKSELIPKDFAGKPANIITAVMMGIEVGLKPFQALQSIAVINGKPSIYGDGALALIMAHPEFEYIKEYDFDHIEKEKKAVCEIKRKDQPAVIRSFSFENAKQANLLEKPIWKLYRPRMIQSRARAFAMRDAFADVLKGVSIAEEVQDYHDEKVINEMPDNGVTIAETKLQELIKTKSEPVINVRDIANPFSVMDKINAAQNNSELLEAFKLIKTLNPQEQKDAKLAYSDRQRALSTQKQTEVQTNGEWIADYDGDAHAE